MWNFLPDSWFILGLCLFILMTTGHNMYCAIHSPQWKRLSGPPLDIVPHHEKEFYVVSQEGQRAVAAFYATLEHAKSERTEPHGFNITEHISLSAYEVDKMLKKLFALDAMWAKLDESGLGGVEDAAVTQWSNLLLHMFYRFCDIGFAKCKVIKDGMQARAATAFMRKLVKYSRIITHPYLHVSPHFEATLLLTLLHLAAHDGFLPAYLVFAHMRPDMVNDECYPALNNETEVYQQHVSYESVWSHKHLQPLLKKYEDFIIL